MKSNASLLEDLKGQIDNGQAIAVVGAGISIATSKNPAIASWPGLLKSGVSRCEEIVYSLPKDWGKSVRASLRSGKLDDLLKVAQEVSKQLGAPRSGEFRLWLRNTVGSLSVVDDSLIRAIADLEIPIVTTNYDNLIEDVTGLPTLTWLDHPDVERVIRGDEKAIIHIHGHWKRPDSIVLDNESYTNVLRDSHTQAILQALRSVRTFLFLGFGSGLKDPNFGRLLEWSRAIFAESEYRHFRLAKNSDVKRFQAEHSPDERIFVIGFGKNYADQAGFLQGLVSPQKLIEKSLKHRPHNLPIQLSRIIGRDHDITELMRLFTDSKTRIVTLTGTGGVGKTRLAIELGSRLISSFPDGIRFVQLNALSSPEYITQSIASTLGVKKISDQRQSIEVLGDFIRSLKMLLILDTCDKYVRECAEISDSLLRLCPNLHILATSRESLDVEGENRWEVNPLEIPKEEWSADQVKNCSSVQLFIERAKESRNDFALTDANIRSIGNICRQLDGIPLAIELAAGRMKDLVNVQQISERLGKRFSLLVQKSPAGPDRQRTLYATIAWSYELLSEIERILFNRLSIFDGGWTLEMAERVCASSEINSNDIMNLMQRLVDKSLIVAEDHQGDVRYRLLDSVRDFASQMLEEKSRELQLLQARHAAYIVSFLAISEPYLWGSQQMLWIRRIEAEHANIRKALKWSLLAKTEGSYEIVSKIWRFWQLRSYLTEGLHWAEATISQETTDSKARAMALLGAAYLARSLWLMDKAKKYTDESISVFEKINDQKGRAMAVSNLAILARARGDYKSAIRLFEESLQQALSTHDQRAIGSRLTNLGITSLFAGHLRIAQAHFEKSIPLLREWGERHILILALRFLGLLNEAKGEYMIAQKLYLESLNVAEMVGDKVGIGAALVHQASLKVRNDQIGRASCR